MTLETSDSAGSSANSTQISARYRLTEGFSYWARRVRLGLILTVTLVVAALAAGIGTYAVLSDITALGSEPDTVLVLLNVDLALLLILAIFVVRRIVSIWSERRKGSRGFAPSCSIGRSVWACLRNADNHCCDFLRAIF